LSIFFSFSKKSAISEFYSINLSLPSEVLQMVAYGLHFGAKFRHYLILQCLPMFPQASMMILSANRKNLGLLIIKDVVAKDEI
jgi:hypothetical protein